MLLKAWIAVVAQHHDLRVLAVTKLAVLSDQSPESLTSWLNSASDYQIQLFWQRLSGISSDIAWLQWLVEQSPFPQPSLALPVWLEVNNFRAIAQGFNSIAHLLPDVSIPGLLLRLPFNFSDITSAEIVIKTLVQIVEATPLLPIGVMLTSIQAQALLSQLPESSAKAMLRSGLIDIVTPDPKTIQQWLGDRGTRDRLRVETILDLAEQYGTTPDLLEAMMILTQPDGNPDTADQFRSTAEWLLLQFLEARPITAGKFKPNQKLDIPFGNRAMEVDFLATDTQIVIELDGYYHFQSPDNYRRDRRKDLALQQQGYLVLRFLADDVVAHHETIMTAIEQSLSLRQS